MQPKTIIIRASGEALDQWDGFPPMNIGETVPSYGFKPSSPTAKRREWRIVGKRNDYRANEITYTVEPV